MNAANRNEQNALSLPQRAALALGESANAAKLRELAAQSVGIVTVTNDDGRAEAHRAGMALRTTRTNITATGKAAREDATAFSKAVIAMEKELIAIIEPEEQRVLALRDQWDEQIAAEKAAKIAAERARTDRVRMVIDNIKAAPLRHVASDSAALVKAVEFYLIMPAEELEYEEFTDEVKQAIGTTLEKLREMGIAAAGAEQAAREAEQARIAEAARLAEEKAELARQRAENQRIAAEQAAEAKRLTDLAAAQEVAARAIQQEADAKAKAERDAQQAAFDKQAAEILAQRRVLEAQQAEADKRDAAAAKKAAEDQQREADHGPALDMNAAYDAARAMKAADEAGRQRLQVLAEQAVEDAHAPTFDPDALMASNAEVTRPFDCEIIELVAERYGMSRPDAVERLARIDFAAARADLA